MCEAMVVKLSFARIGRGLNDYLSCTFEHYGNAVFMRKSNGGLVGGDSG